MAIEGRKKIVNLKGRARGFVSSPYHEVSLSREALRGQSRAKYLRTQEISLRYRKARHRVSGKRLTGGRKVLKGQVLIKP